MAPKDVEPTSEPESWAHTLHAIVDSMREGLQILDFEYRYLYLNRAAAAHGRASREALLGRSLPEMYPGIEKGAFWTALERCMRDRTPAALDNEFTFPDGSTQWFELRLEPVPQGVMILSLDMEARRSLERQLAESQKMEALGRLAGGVAHDFNNLLTVIASYCAFADEAIEPGSPVRADLEQIRDAAQRASAIVQQLLALGRRRLIEPVVVSVVQVIAAIEPLLSRLVGAGVEVTLDLPEQELPIRIDPVQLDQVLLNLAANARDAMPEGGALTVRVQRVTLEAACVLDHVDVPPGEYAAIVVSDTGFGMDEDTRQRAFEPFYTTKEEGRGTGLGLATSHGIVRQAGGYIWLYSEPGMGTTFMLYFPIVPSEPAPLSKPRADAQVDERGDETILVVDDEPKLRALCARALTQRGYTVLEAEGGEEAIRFSERYSGRIDAIVTDVVMPGINGPQLVERLRQVRPEALVLYMSGYADPEALRIMKGCEVLEKPFTPLALLRRLRALLATRT